MQSTIFFTKTTMICMSKRQGKYESTVDAMPCKTKAEHKVNNVICCNILAKDQFAKRSKRAHSLRNHFKIIIAQIQSLQAVSKTFHWKFTVGNEAWIFTNRHSKLYMAFHDISKPFRATTCRQLKEKLIMC